MTVFEQARSCTGRYIIERYFSSVDSKNKSSYWKNGEYWTINPLRITDDTIKNFSISEDGLYNDFAAKDSGDFVKLVSLVFNVSLREAAEKIINDSGGIVEMNEKKQTTKKPEKIGIKIDNILYKKKFNDIANFVKSDYLTNNDNGEKWEAKKIYSYFEYKSKDILFFIVRYESRNDSKIEKKFCPIHLNSSEKVKIGIPDNFKNSRPLYKINSANNDDPILIVEGEKCASVSVPGYSVISWCGGAQAIGKTDWSPLYKRDCYIWPDNDQAGKDTVELIKEHIPHVKPLDVSILDKPTKWDIADASEENEEIYTLIEKMKGAITKHDHIESDPEFAADLFLEDHYDYDNLIKVDGIFWKYCTESHYWKRWTFDNIRCDIQLFLKNKGFFKLLQEEKKSKISFKNNTISFVQDYSLKYFKQNYFLNSSVAPYVHLRNGAIEIKNDGFSFVKRTLTNESYFRNLYPVNCFNFNYDEDIKEKITFDNIKEYAPIFYHMIKTIVPKSCYNEAELIDTMKFVCQMIAYTMSPIKRKPYFFAFYGDGNTAKSSLYYLVRSFIGEEFCASDSIENFTNNRFALSELWGAKVLVDEDMGEHSFLPTEFIKKYSGNVSTTIERKNENRQSGVNLSFAQFYISNYKLKAYGIEGTNRRAFIIKFVNKILDNDVDPDIMHRFEGKMPHNKITKDFEGKVFDERSALIHLIMKEWEGITERKYYIKGSKWIENSTNKFLSEMTSPSTYLVSASLGDRTLVMPGEKYYITDIYDDYVDWCKEEGKKPKNKGSFEEEISRDKNRIDANVRTSARRKGVYKILSYKIDSDSDIEDEITNEDLENVF